MMNTELFNEIITFFVEDKEGVDFCSAIESLNDFEKMLIHVLNRINQKLRCFTPDDTPYRGVKECFKDKRIREDLVAIFETDINSILKAKIADCLWMYTKDFEKAKIAFKLVAQAISSTSLYEEKYFFFNRLASIHLSIKHDDFDYIFQRTLIDMIESGKRNTNAYSIKVLEFAYDKEQIPITQLLSPVKEKLEQLIEVDGIFLSETIFDLLEKLLQEKKSSKKELSALYRKKAEMYLQRLKVEENILRQINLLTSAIKTLKKVDDSYSEISRLQAQLKELQRESIKEMHTFSREIDITKFVEYIREIISRLDKTDCLYYFALGLPIISKNKMMNEMLECKKEFVLSSLFPTEILCKNGRSKVILPDILDGSEAAISANTEHHAVEYYNLYVRMYMVYVMGFIKEKYSILKEDIDYIIKDSYFIPETRKESFAKGLLAGFEGDFITAINILIPQVEFAVRYIAEFCGDVITRVNDDGTQEVILLDSVLRLPCINECVDEDIIFNLRTIFTSKYGLNIRNEVAHGLLDDEDFKSTHCYYAWWFILRLCFEFSTIPSEVMPKINQKINDLKFEITDESAIESANESSDDLLVRGDTSYPT